MIEALQFARPLVLGALLLLPAYAWLRLRHARRERVPYAPLQYRPGPRRRRLAAPLLVLLETVLLGLVLVALAGPYREDHLDLIEDEGIDVALVLDASLSMLAEDFPPNRLEALRGIARDFIARSGGNRTGIVVFAKDVFVQTPLTTDHPVLQGLLEAVTVDLLDQHLSGGTAVGDALLVAAELLHRARVEGRGQALVLITDGESNAGVDPGLAARYVGDAGIRLYAIGVGGEEPVEMALPGRDDVYVAVLDDAQLKAVAELSGGSFYRATDVGALEEIFAQLSRLESAPLEVRRLEVRRPRVRILALAALPLFAGVLLVAGQVLRRPLR